jgi:hypothetical protein
MASLDLVAAGIRRGWPLRTFAVRDASFGTTVGWGLILALTALTGLLLVQGAGGALTLLFPLAATAIGAFLFFVSPHLFLGFAWWLWLLTPEIRRLSDFEGGWNPINPIMLSPMLVSGLAALTLVKRGMALHRKSLFGFLPIFIALVYGTIVGIVTTGPEVALYSLLIWATPVLLGFHLAARWEEFETNRAALLGVFAWGTLVIGGYGLIQYYIAPGWDRYWLINVGMINQGRAYAQEIRVFSTMNSSGPFAFIITAGILLVLANRVRFKLTVIAFGTISLMLSLVRAAWLGGLMGLGYLLLSLRGRTRIRMVAASVAAVALLAIGASSEPVATIIGDRVDTLSELSDDGSYQQRQAFYLAFAARSVGSIVGNGIGSTSYVTKLDNYGEISSGFYGDSGVLQVPFVLGWFGSLLYTGGTVLLLCQAFARSAAGRDAFIQASRAIVLMIGAEMIFENTLINVMGACFWTFLGTCIGARRYAAIGRSTALAHEGARAETGVS